MQKKRSFHVDLASNIAEFTRLSHEHVSSTIESSIIPCHNHLVRQCKTSVAWFWSIVPIFATNPLSSAWEVEGRGKPFDRSFLRKHEVMILQKPKLRSIRFRSLQRSVISRLNKNFQPILWLLCPRCFFFRFRNRDDNRIILIILRHIHQYLRLIN